MNRIRDAAAPPVAGDAIAGRVARIRAQVQEQGFAFVPGGLAREWLLGTGSLDDWAGFARSWDRLGPDLPLAALGRQRRRRHATYATRAGGAPTRLAPRPHYQTLADNPLQGGIERWFEPVEDAVAESASLRTLIASGQRFFADLALAGADWIIEVHQFRIEARSGAPGEPTPEGIHRDGVDWVLVALVERTNIESGTTTIHAGDGRQLGAFTLAAPLDLALVDDRRVLHGVTAVTPVDPTRNAHRDVLVITYRMQRPADRIPTRA